MKIANLTLTVLAIAACSATYAQGKPRMREATARPVFNAQALAAVQSDLGSAIAAMTSALPIYDGDRVKSIHFAHRALVIVDGELAGGKAAFRKQPKVRDHVPSKIHSAADCRESDRDESGASVSSEGGLGLPDGDRRGDWHLSQFTSDQGCRTDWPGDWRSDRRDCHPRPLGLLDGKIDFRFVQIWAVHTARIVYIELERRPGCLLSVVLDPFKECFVGFG